MILWQAPGGWEKVFLLSTREPLVVFVSWLLSKRHDYGSKGVSDSTSFIRFTLLGIFIPNLINPLYTYHYSFIDGNIERVTLLWLSDFITMFLVSIPLLHFFRPTPHGKIFKLQLEDHGEVHLANGKLIGSKELMATTMLFVGLSYLVDFDKYWFLYGIVASMVAVRNGFPTVILTNLVIFVLNYILPLLKLGSLKHGSIVTSQLLSVHLGMGTMFFAASLIGRAISCQRKTESKLIEQKNQVEKTNEKLSKANHEMDRFVYSVSHDISSPLKSIKGLIAISRLESEKENPSYLNHIEASVQKLEDFVGEVLDHSRTNRKEVQLEDVNLKELTEDITENLKYLENFNTIRFTTELTDQSFQTDKFLIKAALGNLLSNAIKYQRKRTDQIQEIKIKSWPNGGNMHIRISDNGEGIDTPYQDKIFEMFYRGTTNSTGSGLGLFIAKEAVEKLKGKIEFTTEYGVGSEFTISIPV
ncbi:MAG: HAMP domain-containing histidine kinase [Bacteroidia bacterium]|nr:HAMP domain-containing histidine kinase [Bacteroidia bacterium]